jgi:hypothetical protein
MKNRRSTVPSWTTGRYIDQIEGAGRADLVRLMFYESPVLVLFLFLGMPDKDVAKVKTCARNRLMLTRDRLSDEAIGGVVNTGVRLVYTHKQTASTGMTRKSFEAETIYRRNPQEIRQGLQTPRRVGCKKERVRPDIISSCG